MGSQGVTGRGTSEPDSSRMVVKSGGNWKRPVNRMYTYNYQVGENYYLPMTNYLESKDMGPPGPRCFSERIAEYPLCGKSIEVYDDKSIQTIKETRQVISSF